ncbi:MAG: DUF4279 domain-containing protein [Chitinophagaceae bacterium]
MKNKIVLRFGIWGFEDVSHEELSNITGITPVKIYKKGERKNPNFTALAKENGWLFQSSDDPCLSFEHQIKDLMKTISTKKEIFKHLSKKYYLEVSCAVYIYFDTEENMPSIQLSPRYAKMLGDLKITFDIDLYCLPG